MHDKYPCHQTTFALIVNLMHFFYLKLCNPISIIILLSDAPSPNNETLGINRLHEHRFTSNFTWFKLTIEKARLPRNLFLVTDLLSV